MFKVNMKDTKTTSSLLLTLSTFVPFSIVFIANFEQARRLLEQENADQKNYLLEPELHIFYFPEGNCPFKVVKYYSSFCSIFIK